MDRGVAVAPTTDRPNILVEVSRLLIPAHLGLRGAQHVAWLVSHSVSGSAAKPVAEGERTAAG